jgi:predicted nucleic acid-binding Zn ribbon protein
VRQRRSSEFEPLGRLVPRVLEDLGLEEAARIVRLAERWEEAVGAEIAGHCQPTALRGATLDATVDSSVWCQQLRLRSPEILAGLRRIFGAEAPSQIRLRVG